jgi:hypothetical protein
VEQKEVVVEAVNINHIVRGGTVANYTLRGEPIKLNGKEFRGYFKPDGDGYEEVWEEVDLAVKSKTGMRLRGSRKQKAARAAVPFSTIKIVKPLEPVAPRVAIAVFEGKSTQEVRIIELEEKIKAVLGIDEKATKAEQAKQAAIKRLKAKFDRRRI